MTQPPDQFDFARIRWIYFGLMIGMFTSSISQTIVSPAIPELPIPQTPADDEPDAEASGREEPGQEPEEGSGR